jgi:CRISPR-associated protein Cas5d
MLDGEIVKIKVTGKYACFTRPDLKVERMTYPCMTPSAARGILDCILWKPEFQWYVRKIIVLNPVKFISVKRNEINSKQGRNPIVVDEVDARGKPLYRAQGNSIILKDTAYIIEASVFQKEADAKNPPKKYVEMFRRRVKKGQCWRRPYLGTREFAAEFMEVLDTDKPDRYLLDSPIPIGSMLFDIFYDESGKPSPLFFYDAVVKDGVLDLNKLPENDRMMRSSHFRETLDYNLCNEIDALNLQEEEANL